MARPRSFCDKKALKDAMMVFWAKGYEAASLAELTKAMGLSKSSFYETFGCKRELFLKALNCYMAGGASYFETIFTGRSFREGMNEIYKSFIDKSLTDCKEQGCFMFKVASELACRDEVIRGRVAEGFEGIVEVFKEKMEADQAAGVLRADLDVESTARFFVNQNAGLNAYAQVQEDRTKLEAMLGLSLKVLD